MGYIIRWIFLLFMCDDHSIISERLSSTSLYIFISSLGLVYDLVSLLACGVVDFSCES